MHIIVIGGGRTGRAFIERATENAHEVVVVEKDRERAQRLSADFDCLVINADAASREIMDEAGLDRADAVVATTRDDSVNLMVSLMATQASVGWVVSTIDDEDHLDMFDDLGVDAVESPQRLAGRHLYDRIVRPKVRDSIKVSGDVEVLDVEVSQGSDVAGRPLSELVSAGILGDQSIIAAVIRNEDVIVPKGSTTLEPGDLVTLLSRTDTATDITESF